MKAKKRTRLDLKVTVEQRQAIEKLAKANKQTMTAYLMGLVEDDAEMLLIWKRAVEKCKEATKNE